MARNFDFANLTAKQKIAVTAKVEIAKGRWLDAVFKKLMPPLVYEGAHHGWGRDAAAEWLNRNGYRIVDNWTADGLGAALLKGDKVVSEFKVEVSENESKLYGANGKKLAG